MKKKILSLTLVVCLLAIAVVGGTMAYFTDTDSAKNVMTMGNVNIVQNETDKDGEAFVQNQPLMPMVDTRAEGDAVVVDGFFNEAMKNVIDKVVTVKNEAPANAVNQDAYVRTVLAFETQRHYAEGSSEKFTDMFDEYIGVLGDFDVLDEYITVDGVEYRLAVKVYDKALVPQEESAASLKQVFLAPTANNEVMDIFGAEYTILAVSQATQTTGFANAAEALDTAFGAVNAANAAAWF